MTLQSELQKSATQWARRITEEAKNNLGKFGRLIGVQSRTEVGDGVVSIQTVASNKARSEYGDVKNVAHAYEYGSGIHSKTAPHKYRIAPRRKKALAFFWEKMDTMEEESLNAVFNSPKFIGFADDGRAMFRFVDHPGVQAANNGRGYMKPAIDKVRRQIRKETPEVVRKEVRLTIRRGFKKS